MSHNYNRNNRHSNNNHHISNRSYQSSVLCNRPEYSINDGYNPSTQQLKPYNEYIAQSSQQATRITNQHSTFEGRNSVKVGSYPQYSVPYYRPYPQQQGQQHYYHQSDLYSPPSMSPAAKLLPYNEYIKSQQQSQPQPQLQLQLQLQQYQQAKQPKQFEQTCFNYGQNSSVGSDYKNMKQPRQAQSQNTQSHIINEIKNGEETSQKLNSAVKDGAVVAVSQIKHQDICQNIEDNPQSKLKSHLPNYSEYKANQVKTQKYSKNQSHSNPKGKSIKRHLSQNECNNDGDVASAEHNNDSNSDYDSDSFDEQEIYMKSYKRNKPIHKMASNGNSVKKPYSVGVGMDSPQEIRKWVQARKKNYPTLQKIKQADHQVPDEPTASSLMMSAQEKKELSQLQLKIRKKISILNSDSRGNILKKIRNIDLLRRIIQHPDKILNDKATRKQHHLRQEKKRLEEAQRKLKRIKDTAANIEAERQLRNRQKVEEQYRLQKLNEFKAIQIQRSQMMEQDNQEAVELLNQNQLEGQIAAVIAEADDNESSQSHQPIQIAANKIQSKELPKLSSLALPAMECGIVDEKTDPDINKNTNNLRESNQRDKRSDLDPAKIILHLQQKQEEDRLSLNTLFDYKSNSYNYKYRVQTLQTNLKLEDIFAETTYLLQAIRYIVKEKQDFIYQKI